MEQTLQNICNDRHKTDDRAVMTVVTGRRLRDIIAAVNNITRSLESVISREA